MQLLWVKRVCVAGVLVALAGCGGSGSSADGGLADAGSDPLDAGLSDSGDGGTHSSDGGANENDGGVNANDGGVNANDGGVNANDGGTNESDGGVTVAVRAAAAAATAEGNALCVAIRPFYWEIGDVNGALGSGSVGGTTYRADTVLAIASASKWFYSTYWVQRTKGALSSEDVKFLNFWSGYTKFTGCGSSATVGDCLTKGTNGVFDPATENKFSYGGGHMQKHAALNGLADMNNEQLANELRSQLGNDISFTFETPQLAGGMSMSAAEYAKLLRKIISGELVMKKALGTHPVCTDPDTCPLALNSPSPTGEQWQYSVGHWLETDPVKGDGAFSSAGAFGFYPWVDSTKTLYGVLSRKGLPGSGNDSIACGRLIRKAWVTGTAVP